MASLEDKVYRLRDIPADRDRLGVAELIKPFIPDGKLEDITIASLAPTCGFPGRSPTKTATVTVRKTPEIMNNSSTTGEWKLCTPALTNPLILDATFYGLTPLNEVEEHQHKYDCIVISGLASHPMGSWQPRGDDKSYMWIRDTLPQLVPGVRFILYGYDTKLMGRGWTAVNSKELIFLAHSLGGVVLKQCLYMLADSDAAFQSIIDKTKGGIFFGVPSEGMNIQDIQDMLKDQPNRDALVAEISSDSSFLSSLEKRISGITGIRKMKFFWAYETQMTSTLESVNGTYRRSGPGTIMVSPQSATGNRCNSDPVSTMPINEDHSKMVKFSVGNHMIDTVADKLREILGNDQHGLDQDLERLAASNFQARASTSQGLSDIGSSDTRDPSEHPDFWYLKSIIKSLRAPERDKRLSQIDKRAGHSFEWAFEDPSIGLTEWLQKGDGLYWISGRPASGKSTFMKFLYNDKRTKQMLRHWYSKGKQHVEANFFFHYRGNLIQKSFEGLLRSILSQILEQAPASFSIIQPLFQHRYRQLINEQSLGSLYQDLEETNVTHDEGLSSKMKRKLHAISGYEMPEKLFHTILVEPLRTSNGASIDWQKIEKIILPCREQLLEILRQVTASKNPSATKAERFKSLWQAKLLEAKPPVYLPKWNKKTSHRFFSLLFQWLERIDLKSNLLGLRGLPRYRYNNDSATLTPTEEKIIQDVQYIMHRYHEREKIRQFVQNEPWASPKLQQALFEIIHQQSINLEVCLFIDALDEHDGSPEFIVEFLKDITRKKKKSRTRLKILFSSRPWDIFMTAFGNRPGFRIHEHTENDIRELCIHIIQTECPHSQELLELIEEIVKRSNGVFLWVKLVLQDLTKIAVGALESDTGNLSSKSQDTLRSLPSDLIEYYRTIVERIPMSFRREAFCLLEVLAKQRQDIYLRDVPMILDCLRFSDFSARDDIREKSSNFNIRTLESLIRTHTGGLIEIYGPKKGLFKSMSRKLQLMHQTTVDFIQLPEFKSIILESGEQAMSDNGFTFLAKFSLLKWANIDNGLPSAKNSFYHYVNNAEKTTGKSLYSFFLGSHSNVIEDFHPSTTCYSGFRVSAFSSDIIEMAFGANLRLFIRDYLQANPSILSRTNACCAGNVVDSFKSNVCSQEEAIQMIDLLASKSFQFRKHADCLADALLDLRVDGQNYDSYDSYDSVLQSITRNFAGIETVRNSTALGAVGAHYADKEIFARKPSLLHISSLNITKDLLARKANPNIQDIYGSTPLDGYTTNHYGMMFCPHEYQYQLMVVLAQNGGRLNSSTRKQWETTMTRFQSKGLDISIFEQLKFPKWIPKEGEFLERHSRIYTTYIFTKARRMFRRLGKLKKRGTAK